MLHELVHDARYAIRGLLKAPGFAAVAILTLALGIGANSAIFSFVDGVLLKPLPYAEPERILLVWEKPPGGGINVVSAMNFLDWRSQSSVFTSVAAITGRSVTLTGHGDPQLLRGARTSAGYFDILGIKPALGRTFAPDEDTPGREKVVVLSYRLWATIFGADPGLVGQTIVLDGEPHTVIGVMPQGSVFDRTFNALWRPLAFTPAERTRNFHWLQVFARLKPGVTLEQARAQMDGIGANIARDYPDSNKGWGVSIVPYADSIVGPQLRSSLYVLLAAVGMLLLIGCANLANLTLARGTSREREVAVRAAMGAGRGRLVRQFLTENVVLAAAGGVAGLGVGYAFMRLLNFMLPPFFLPAAASVRLDTRLLLFSLALSVATGLVFGLAPALQATTPDLAGAMKEGGRGSSGDTGRRRVRSALVVVEVALAFILLAGGGLLVRSFFQMMNVPLGFDATNVLTLRLPIGTERFASGEVLSAYVRRLSDRIRAVPGVRGAAATNALPLEGFNYGMPFLIAGREAVDRANRQGCGFKMVQADYFKVLGIHVLRGRPFTDRDVKGAPPAAIINQVMATRFFADQNPIGQRVLVQEIVPGKPQLGPEIAWEIVGVIADERTGGLDGATRPGIYVPMEQSPDFFVNMVIRADVEPEPLARAVTAAVHEIDKDQVVTDVRTLERIKTESAAPNRLRTLLLAVFAGLALVLSAVGIYGVISYTVVQRTHELGVRAALGASKGALLGMVLRQGMLLAALGLVVGVAGAVGVTRLLATLLVGVGARDPMTLVGAAVLLALVALFACYIPARRAARLDPVAALRES